VGVSRGKPSTNFHEYTKRDEQCVSRYGTVIHKTVRDPEKKKAPPLRREFY